MSITVTSTTDSAEVVAALNKPDVAKAEQKVETSAPTEGLVEKLEASEAPIEAPIEAAIKEEEEEGEKTPEEAAKKKGGFQKKIGKLTKQRESARAEAEYWRAEALKNAKAPAEKLPIVEAKAPIDGKPTADNFESHEAYVEALADWKVDQKLSARDLKQKESALKTDFERQVSTHTERVQKFSKDHADWTDLMESVDDIPMSQTVQQVILESDNGAELMYELAKNREEYEKICKLPAIAAARELGKFEARLLKSSESSEKKETKTTKAPAPISPIGGSSTGSGKKSLDDPNLSQREYEKLRNEQIKAQRA